MQLFDVYSLWNIEPVEAKAVVCGTRRQGVSRPIWWSCRNINWALIPSMLTQFVNKLQK